MLRGVLMGLDFCFLDFDFWGQDIRDVICLRIEQELRSVMAFL